MSDTTADKEHFQWILAEALGDALNEFYCSVARLRLGVGGSAEVKLHKLCSKLKLSEQRVTQVVNRSLQVIYLRGQRQIAEGRYGAPCAVLLLYLDQLAGPRNVKYLEGMSVYATNMLPAHSPWFATHVVSRLHNGARDGAALYNRAKMLIPTIVERRRKELYLKQRVAEWQHLTQFIVWTKCAMAPVLVQKEECASVRQVSSGKGNWIGCIHSSKMNRAVQFESELERWFYLGLEAVDEVLWYQEQPYTLPYSAAGKTFECFPDVLIALSDGRYVLAEIKPVQLMPLTKNINKCKALFDFCTARGWGMLVTDGKAALQELLLKEVDQEFETVLIDRLNDGPLYEQEYKSIAANYPDAEAELPAIVLRRDLVYWLEPFVLRNSRQPCSLKESILAKI